MTEREVDARIGKVLHAIADILADEGQYQPVSLFRNNLMAIARGLEREDPSADESERVVCNWCRHPLGALPARCPRCHTVTQAPAEGPRLKGCPPCAFDAGDLCRNPRKNADWKYPMGDCANRKTPEFPKQRPTRSNACTNCAHGWTTEPPAEEGEPKRACCDTCLWWCTDPRGRELALGYGECRCDSVPRNTYKDDWCGSHKPKGEKEPAPAEEADDYEVPEDLRGIDALLREVTSTPEGRGWFGAALLRVVRGEAAEERSCSTCAHEGPGLGPISQRECTACDDWGKWLLKYEPTPEPVFPRDRECPDGGTCHRTCAHLSRQWACEHPEPIEVGDVWWWAHGHGGYAVAVCSRVADTLHVLRLEPVGVTAVPITEATFRERCTYLLYRREQSADGPRP